MKEMFTIEKEFSFKNNVYEITTISTEHNYDINNAVCQGEFLISGDYRLHEVSINKEDFSFKVPFSNEIKSNINLDSVEVNINDFSYELNNNKLKVKIEYLIEGEQSLIEFAKETDLDDFLQKNDAEVIDLSDVKNQTEKDENLNNKPVLKVEQAKVEKKKEEVKEEKIIKKEAKKEVIKPVLKTEKESKPLDNESAKYSKPFLEVREKEETEEKEEDLNEKLQEQRKHKKEEKKSDEIDKNAIVDSINSEESFVTYNIHTVTASDTVDNICEKYKINLNDLKKLNEFEELTLNMKLIIPDEEDY